MQVSALSTPLPTSSSQDATLDVRVAFSDTEGDETKAIGVLTVVVTSAGMQLASTEVPLSDERTHRSHWDSVTETYAVRVPLTGSLEPQPGQTLEVRAVFEGEDGALMRASRDIKWPLRGTTSAKRKGKPANTPPSAVSSAAEPEQ